MNRLDFEIKGQDHSTLRATFGNFSKLVLLLLLLLLHCTHFIAHQTIKLSLMRWMHSLTEQECF